MSDIKIVSPSSGTATFTLTTPGGTSTDRTLTLPDQTSGTVLTTESNVAPKVPAFQVASTSTAGLGQNVVTKWPFNDISGNDFDTHSYFDTTNYRYTPQIAGYYLFSTIIQTGHSNNSASNVRFLEIWFYKNGTGNNPTFFYPIGNLNTAYFGATRTEIIYLNGSTDYVEVYAKCEGNNRFILGSLSQFQGILLRS